MTAPVRVTGAAMKLGIDFGTTNSAVARVRPDGRPEIVELYPGERTQRTVIHATTEGSVTLGNPAFQAYLDADLTGRFLRSLKAFLSHDVPSTYLGGRSYTFPDLIASYLRFLVARAERAVGAPVTEIVLGRPVVFHADPVRNAAALARLEAAISAAGIDRYHLQLEPVAAAYLHERSLSRERLLLVGDFGGGTSDFAVLRVGPDRVGRADRLDDILGTAGVAEAGDALDGRFLDTFLSDAFGRGATYQPPGSPGPIPWYHPIQHKIQQLYYLHQLRTADLEAGLWTVEPMMTDPRIVRRIRRLVFDDLGYPMAWAIEATKRELGSVEETTFSFREFLSDALNLEVRVDRTRYADGARPLLERYDAAISAALDQAGLNAAAIDDVFLTGGTSRLPFVQELFVARFGADKLRSGDSFTSVCEGLALSRS